MQIFRDYRAVSDRFCGGSVAIGNFDGLHLGHMAVIDHMKRAARQHGGPSIVMSFEPHPRRYFNPDKERERLVPFHHKARLLKEAGIDILLAQRFNRHFSQLNAQQFIETVLMGQLKVQHVTTGDDFIFGHKRSGNVQLLRDYAAGKDAFDYTAIEAVGEGPNGYSSSMIRQYVAAGEMEEAAAMLGRPYGWMGRVIHGDKRGRTIGFPTANMMPPPVLLPKFGVYAVMVRDLEGETEPMAGVANMGVRPTVDGATPLLEVHLFDKEIDLYSKRIYVEFLSFIRPEQTFEGIEALKTQITIDCQKARQILGV